MPAIFFKQTALPQGLENQVSFICVYVSCTMWPNTPKHLSNNMLKVFRSTLSDLLQFHRYCWYHLSQTNLKEDQDDLKLTSNNNYDN